MDLAFTRFMTCMIMCVALMSEITMGMQKMKYALNHQFKFRRWRYAFASGLMQCLVGYSVSIISYLVIILGESTVDIVKDFLALYVIAELGQYLFKEYSLNKEAMKQIVIMEDYQGILEI